MNLDRASETLRDCVLGREVVEKIGGGQSRMTRELGLLEIVQGRVQGPERELAILHLGKILGVADAASGVKFKE